jgi:hypothetical protein
MMGHSIGSLEDDCKETICTIFFWQNLHYLLVDYLQVMDLREMADLVLVLLAQQAAGYVQQLALGF